MGIHVPRNRPWTASLQFRTSDRPPPVSVSSKISFARSRLELKERSQLPNQFITRNNEMYLLVLFVDVSHGSLTVNGENGTHHGKPHHRKTANTAQLFPPYSTFDHSSCGGTEKPPGNLMLRNLIVRAGIEEVWAEVSGWPAKVAGDAPTLGAGWGVRELSAVGGWWSCAILFSSCPGLCGAPDEKAL